MGNLLGSTTRAAIAILRVLAIAIGWARICSGAHGTSDVLGGYAFGIAIAALGTLVLHQIPTENPD